MVPQLRRRQLHEVTRELVDHDALFWKLAPRLAELGRLADANLPDRIVLCASPRMLGLLRGLTARLHRPGRFFDELPRDIVKLTAPELREYLESYGLLPPRVTAGRESATNRAR